MYDPATGRVRTDLAAEGSDRNKVAKQLPASALRVADRVAGGIGLGTLKGKPEPYLCHTLCELGAEPLDRELNGDRDVPRRTSRPGPDRDCRGLRPALDDRRGLRHGGADALRRNSEAHAPLPTLGELITSGRRLLVFAEVKGGSPAWYMPAFSFIQDTPLGAVHPGQLSCARYRGTPDSPMLLLNHWIPPFPPSPTLNAQIGRAPFLRAPHIAMHRGAPHPRRDRGRRLLRAHRRGQSRTRAQLQALIRLLGWILARD